MSQKCKFCFLLYIKEIYAQFVETNVLVKHNIYHELKLTIMDLDWQITWKHPVLGLSTIALCDCKIWILAYLHNFPATLRLTVSWQFLIFHISS